MSSSQPSDSDASHTYDGNDSSESEDGGVGALLDLEAAESDSVASDHEHFTSRDTVFYSFPQFCRLPIEIRHRIWEFFCPDLTVKGRVLDFTYTAHRGPYSHITEGRALSQITAPARAVLATHQESRFMAMKKYPDSVALSAPEYPGEQYLVPFNKTTDLILLSYHASRNIGGLANDFTGKFFENIHHLAIDWPTLAEMDAQTATFIPWFLDIILPLCQQLKTILLCDDDGPYSVRGQANSVVWCGLPSTRSYLAGTFEEEPGLNENWEAVYCWPDMTSPYYDENDKVKRAIQKFLQPLQRAVDLHCCGHLSNHLWATDERWREEEHVCSTDRDDLLKVEVLPMIRFEEGSGIEGLQKLRMFGGYMPEEDSNEESSEEEPDEYESSGIDDGEIEEGYNEDSDDLVVQSGSDGPSEADDDVVDPSGYAAANFSSPEPEPAPAQNGDVVDISSDESPVHRVKQSKRRVVDSDSDAASTPEAPIRTATSNRRSRVLRDESEEDDSDHDTKISEAVGQDAVSSLEEDSEDAEAAQFGPRRPMSLAERLAMHREQNPVPASESDRSSRDREEAYGAGEEDDEDEDSAEDEIAFQMMAEEAEDGEDSQDDEHE